MKENIHLIPVNETDDPHCLFALCRDLSHCKERFAILICGKRPDKLLHIELPDGWKYKPLRQSDEISPGRAYHASEDHDIMLVNGEIKFGEKLKPDSHESNGALNAEERNELELLRALVNNSEEGMAVLSPDAKAAYCSPAAERILAYGRGELKGTGVHELLHPDDFEHVNKVMQKAMSMPGKNISGGAVRMRRKDGVWRWCDATITNALDNPAVGGIMDHYRDVTDLVEARQESERILKHSQILINSTEDMLCCLDGDLHLVSANDAFVEFMTEACGIEMEIGMRICEQVLNGLDPSIRWADYLEQTFQGKRIDFEFQHTHTENEVRHFGGTLFPGFEEGRENERYITLFAQDITGRKAQELRMESLMNKLLRAQHIASLGHWEYDLLSGRVTCSENVLIMLGLQAEAEMNLEKLQKLCHPEDRAAFVNAMNRENRESSDGIGAVFRMITPSGEQKWMRHYAEYFYDEDGNLERLEGACQDISRKMQISKELEVRNAFIERIMDHLPVGLAVTHLDSGERVLVNRRMEEISGFSQEELLGENNLFARVFEDPECVEKVKYALLRRTLEEDYQPLFHREINITTKSGEQRIVNIHNIPIPEQGLMVTSAMDVTESVHRRKELRLSNERYAFASMASFDAIWDYDVIKGVVHWGAGMEANFGHHFPEGYSTIEQWEKLVSHEDSASAVASLEAALKDPKQNHWQSEYSMKKADGSYAFVLDRGYILRKEDGMAERMVGAIQDMSRRRAEELELRLRESVISSSREGVVIAEIDEKDSPDDRIVYANSAFCRMIGRPYEDVIGKATNLVFEHSDDVHARKQFEKSKQIQSNLELEWPNELNGERKIWWSLSMWPVPNESGEIKHRALIINDITESRSYIELLRKQNKKLKDIAFTQSHIVRAPLSRLLGLIHLIEGSDKKDESFEMLLQKVQETALELDEIIHRIVGKTAN